MKFIKDYIAIALILGGTTFLLQDDCNKFHNNKVGKNQNTVTTTNVDADKNSPGAIELTQE